MSFNGPPRDAGNGLDRLWWRQGATRRQRIRRALLFVAVLTVAGALVRVVIETLVFHERGLLGAAVVGALGGAFWALGWMFFVVLFYGRWFPPDGRRSSREQPPASG